MNQSLKKQNCWWNLRFKAPYISQEWLNLTEVLQFFCYLSQMYFHWLGPLGRVSHRVAMSVCLLVCLSAQSDAVFFEASHWPWDHMISFLASHWLTTPCKGVILADVLPRASPLPCRDIGPCVYGSCYKSRCLLATFTVSFGGDE